MGWYVAWLDENNKWQQKDAWTFEEARAEARRMSYIYGLAVAQDKVIDENRYEFMNGVEV